MIDYVLADSRGLGKKASLAVANRLGTPYQDMLALGQWILDGNDPDLFMTERGAVKKFTMAQLEEAERRGRLIFPRDTSPASLYPGMVPVISWVQAGGWKTVCDNYQPGDGEEWVSPSRQVSKCAFALRVHGTSMEPEFREGDVIIVDPGIQHESGSLVVARLNGADEATFKKLVRDGDRTYLEPLNSRYQPLDITGRDVTICGVVRQVIRNVG